MSQLFMVSGTALVGCLMGGTIAGSISYFYNRRENPTEEFPSALQNQIWFMNGVCAFVGGLSGLCFGGGLGLGLCIKDNHAISL